VRIPDSVNYKIIRAITHLKELQAEVERYFETNPAKVVRQAEGDPSQFVGKLEARGPIPARFPVIIGDCLQNARSALDYLVWELVLAAKNQPGRHNMFPVCSTLEWFDRQLINQRRLDGVATDAIAEIRGLQPYHRGQDFDKTMLWIIDDLCNINKHRRVLLTHLHGSQAPGDIEIQTVNGELRANVDLVTMKNDAKIGPFPIVNGSCGPGVQVGTNLHILAFMSFNEGAAQNMEVCLVLNEMLRYLDRDVLPRFERFFA
jgi:hypothetical protein